MQTKRTLGMMTLALAGVTLACSEATITSDHPSGTRQPPVSPYRATVAAFDCALTYHAITQTDETELAPYGVEPVTDTARICESWTGSDYNVEVVQVGSSEPTSDYAEDIKTVVYQSGSTKAYDAYGNFVESQPDVGPTSFDFVAADNNERQASYNDPYYGVLVSSDPNCTESCVQMSRTESPSASAQGSSVRRAALKALLKNRTELSPSPDGLRRFQHVTSTGDSEIISFDPKTELIRRRELSNAHGTLRADLAWTLWRGKYVRDRMDIVSEELVRGKRYTSRTTVLIREMEWNPALVK